jgi:nucleotide-binding universal stress UspA family protein
MAPAGAAPRRTVVVGYNGSAEAERALTCALERAGPRGRVIVVNATLPQPDVFARPSVEPLLHNRLREGHALVDLVFLERSDVFDNDIDAEVIEDAPAAALLEAARRHDADEIVVGHRDRGRLRSLSGSVAHTLVDADARPVIVVVPPGP